MAARHQWTWVWATCRWWWRTGKPGMLPSAEVERTGHGWVTEQQQHCPQASRVAQWWGIRLAMHEPQETQDRSLGREDPLEEEVATYSSILAWETPGTEEPGGLQSVGLQRVRHDWASLSLGTVARPCSFLTVFLAPSEHHHHGGLGDLSFPTRDVALGPCSGREES